MWLSPTPLLPPPLPQWSEEPANEGEIEISWPMRHSPLSDVSQLVTLGPFSVAVCSAGEWNHTAGQSSHRPTGIQAYYPP